MKFAMVSLVGWFCGFLLVLGVQAYKPNSIVSDQEEGDVDHNLVYHARDQLTDLLQMFITLIETASVKEGQILDLPQIPESLQDGSSKALTLEDLFDTFETTCHLFRTRFLSFIRTRDVDPKVEFTEGTLSEQRTTEEDLSTESNLNEVTVEYVSSEEAESVGDLQGATEYTFVPGWTTVQEMRSVPEYGSTQRVPEQESANNSERDVEYQTSVPVWTNIEDALGTTEYVNSDVPAWTFLADLKETSAYDESTSDKEKDSLELKSMLESRSGLLHVSDEAEFSAQAVPGEDFPNYEDIPVTSFTCQDKVHVPGFYADLESGCQVFHVCWPDRRESFLCPSGTTFNQPVFSCDYWNNSACPLSTAYYYLNENYLLPTLERSEGTKLSAEQLYSDTLGLSPHSMKFLPIKFKTVYSPEIVAEVTQSSISSETTPEYLGQSLESKDTSEIEVLVSKIVQEVLDSSINIAREVQEAVQNMQTSEHLPKLRQKLKKLADIKTDRSGDQTEQPPELDPDFTMPPAFDETDTVVQNGKSRFSKPKYLHSKLGKEQLAPAIVMKVLEAADDVVNRGILPLTRQALAASYSKLHKVKKQ